MATYKVTQVFVLEAESKSQLLLDLQLAQSDRQIERLEWQSVVEVPQQAAPVPEPKWRPWVKTLAEQLTAKA